jgi:hypothetical protein
VQGIPCKKHGGHPQNQSISITARPDQTQGLCDSDVTFMSACVCSPRMYVADHPGLLTECSSEDLHDRDPLTVTRVFVTTHTNTDTMQQNDTDDDDFYLFLQIQNRSLAPHTLRKVCTISGCLEGLTLMI